MRLSISLLGPFRAQVGHKELGLSRAKKIEALLAYLVMEADRPHPRSVLDGLFFPEMPGETARTNLRQTMTRLRRAIRDARADPPFILLTPETMQFNPASDYELDVHLFQEKLQGCAQHTRQRDRRCPECINCLQEAVVLYRGPFLDEFFIRDSEEFELWMQTIQERLHQEVMEALQDLADYYEWRGEYKRAADYAQRQLELDPWREEAHRQLMRLLARQGQRSAALAQYQQCRRSLSIELGVAPHPDTQALYEHIWTACDLRPHNLPPLGDRSFVGRETELGLVRQYLVDPNRRLLTLVGQGGIGKTHLALKVSWAIVQDYLGPFMDGVYFILLTDTAAPDEIDVDRTTTSFVTAIIKALDLSLSGPESPQQQILDALRGRECLLFVDNGEHLTESGRAFLAEIVRQIDGVQILVASRQRLNLAEEWILEIEGLPFPREELQRWRPAGTDAFGLDAEAFAAIRLFRQRACQVAGDFALNGLTAEERASVVRISQLTQGMPLALELAAAWVRTISCRQIAREIEKGIDILAHVQPDRPARHHSIRAAFDHSWRMLSSTERQVLAKLSVFRGSFSLEAAEQMAEATLFILSGLRDKSLLQSLKEVSGVRYEMHPLLRQFSAEKLQDPAETRACHAQYYGQFLYRKREKLDGLHMLEARQEIQKEIENIRFGWQWAVNQGRVKLVGQYADTLYVFYNLCGWRYEGRDMFRQAAGLKGQDLRREEPEHILVLVSLLLRLALFNRDLGSLDQAEMLLQECRELAFHVEEGEEIARAHEGLGLVAYRRGDYAEAMEFLQFGLQVAQDVDNKYQQAHILMALGAVARDLGDYALARQCFQKSVVLHRAVEYPWGIAHSLRLLATVACQTQEYQQAQAYNQESIHLFQAIDDPIGEGLAWNNLGQIAQAEQQYAQAQTLYERGVVLLQEADDDMGMALVFRNLGCLMSDLGRWQQASAYFYAGFQKALQVQDLTLILALLVDIGHWFLQEERNGEMKSKVIELLHFVYHHPASPPPVKAESACLLTELDVPQHAWPTTTSARKSSIGEVQQLVDCLLAPPGSALEIDGDLSKGCIPP